MTFISVEFAIFFAVSVLVYYLLPHRFRAAWLTLSSIVFYLFSGPLSAVYILSTSLVTFFCALGAGKTREEFYSKSKELKKTLPEEEFARLQKKAAAKKRFFTALPLTLNLGILVVLLYLNFILENVYKIAGAQFTALNLLVPLGLSFYTFAAVGYTIDVSRGKYPPERNPINFLLFMTYFPHVTNGPIPRYEKIAPEFAKERKFDYDTFTDGLRLCLWGVFKQLVVAGTVSPYVSRLVKDGASLGGAGIWFGMILWGVELYASFSGSIDFVRGLSECYGIPLGENFKRPYFAVSLTDYWNRWHITLSDWLKDYVFYPMALSGRFARFSKFLKKKFGKFVAKTLPVGLLSLFLFTLVGVWHGANWGEILFGVFNGAVIMISTFLEPVFLKIRPKLGMEKPGFWRVFRSVRTFIIITLTRVVSKAPSVGVATGWYFRMFFSPGFAKFGDYIASEGGIGKLFLSLLPAIIGVAALFTVSLIEEKKDDCGAVRAALKERHVLRVLLEVLLLTAVIIMGSYGIGYDASNFVYPPRP